MGIDGMLAPSVSWAASNGAPPIATRTVQSSTGPLPCATQCKSTAGRGAARALVIDASNTMQQDNAFMR